MCALKVCGRLEMCPEEEVSCRIFECSDGVYRSYNHSDHYHWVIYCGLVLKVAVNDVVVGWYVQSDDSVAYKRVVKADVRIHFSFENEED